jgi:hypothetical protein
MNLLIKFPTRGRPDKALKTLVRYINYMDDKSNRILVTCDLDDESMNNEEVRDILTQYENVVIKYGDNKSKIEAVNADLKDEEFDIVLLASDDMLPIVKGYDTLIKSRMSEIYPDTDGVLWFNDGYQGDRLNTLSILGKKYYDRFGYIYHPEYKSVWCDNEFMAVSRILDKVTYFDTTIIRHEHPDWGFNDRDDIHRCNYLNENHDRMVYFNRNANNFGL